MRNASVFFSWHVSSFSIPYVWFYSLILYTYAWKSFIHLFVQYLYPQCSRILQWTKPDKKHCHHGAYFLTYIECQMMTRTRREIEQRGIGMPGCWVDMYPYLSHTGWETQHKCSLLIFSRKVCIGHTELFLPILSFSFIHLIQCSGFHLSFSFSFLFYYFILFHFYFIFIFILSFHFIFIFIYVIYPWTSRVTSWMLFWSSQLPT